VKKAVAALVVLVVVAAGGVSVWGYFFSGCAGQCGSPHYLVVQFVPGTSPTEAKAVIDQCGRGPSVVSVGAVTGGGQRDWREARIWTTTFGRNPKTQPLLDCLHRSGVVNSAAWPA
jgi:hypothetical protein